MNRYIKIIIVLASCSVPFSIFAQDVLFAPQAPSIIRGEQMNLKGKVRYMHMCKYSISRNGNQETLIKTSDTNTFDEVLQVDYRFDEKDRLTEMNQYSPKDELIKKKLYYYNDDLLIAMEEYAGYETITNRYRYDTQNRIVESRQKRIYVQSPYPNTLQSHYLENKEDEKSVYFTYDEKNRLKEMIEDSNFNDIIHFTYDEENYTNEVFRKLGKISNRDRAIYKYSPDGQLLSQTTYETNNNIRSLLQISSIRYYNVKKQIVKIESFNRYDNYNKETTIFAYDASGNVITTTKSRNMTTQTTNYEYDKIGNWIKSQSSEHYIYIRQIEYY